MKELESKFSKVEQKKTELEKKMELMELQNFELKGKVRDMESMARAQSIALSVAQKTKVRKAEKTTNLQTLMSDLQAKVSQLDAPHSVAPGKAVTAKRKGDSMAETSPLSKHLNMNIFVSNDY